MSTYSIKTSMNAARRYFSALAKTAYLTFAVIYVGIYFVFQRAFPVILIPGFALDRITGISRLVERFPLFSLFASGLAMFWIAGHGIGTPFGQTWINISTGFIVWAVFLSLFMNAYYATTALPADVETIESVVRERWPERWYARHLKCAADAVFIRFLIANSAVMLPATAALILPSTVSACSALTYVSGLMLVSYSHEHLDHIDIHNNLFDSRHLTWPANCIVRATSRYLRFVLNPACGRIPGFYRMQHLYNHHVEDNGVADIQTTLHADRTSFFGFCRYALTLGTSFSFALDIYLYLRRKGKTRQCRSLLCGLAAWYVCLLAIAVYNPRAALLLFAARLLGGVASAATAYLWHGLADPYDPENVYKNSSNLACIDTITLDSMHLRHHLFGGEHWTKQCCMSPEDNRLCKDNQAFAFSLYSPHLFLKALWTRRFDFIAATMLSPEGYASNVDSLAETIALRTKPLADIPRSRLYRNLDDCFGRFFSNCLVPGVRIPKAPAK